MITSVGHVTIPVGDYEQALAWYQNVLGLEVRANVAMSPGYRWISVGAHGQPDLDLVLHLSDGAKRRRTGDPTPRLVFYCDDCHAEYERLRVLGVVFARPPAVLPWGVQALLLDPFGNSYVLMQRRGAGETAAA